MIGKWSESLKQLREDIEREHEQEISTKPCKQDDTNERRCKNGVDSNS